MKIRIRQPLTFSEIGRKDNQEDCVYPIAKGVSEGNRFFILCDGMGGHDSGEVASATVCNALGKYFENHIPEDGIMTTELFNQALNYAYDELDKQDTGSVKKMGTTMTCLYLHKNGYLVAHIGDSRIYHVRPLTGIVYQSSDHSLVNDLLRIGELTEEEAKTFPQKNVITRAMQPHLERRHKADVFSFSDIKSGDYFFMCSDGVLEQLTNDRLCEILSAKNLTDSEKIEAIKGICDGNTKDNYTCFLIPIDSVLPESDDVENIHDSIVAGVEVEECTVPEVSDKLNVRYWKRYIKWGFGLVVVLCAVGIWLFINPAQNQTLGTETTTENENIEIKAVDEKDINEELLLKEDSNNEAAKESLMNVLEPILRKDTINPSGEKETEEKKI